MNVDELKREIEARTGVPASFLNGETTEETIASAKAMLALTLDDIAKAAQEDSIDSTLPNREQFAAWMKGQNE